MITINKQSVLFLAITSISWLAYAPTITIPHETIQQQDVSLFLLVQDQNGEHKGGVFQIDANESVKTITTDDFQNMNDATLNLEGEEVAVFDFGADYSIRQNIVYFEIDADVRVIKALIIHNSLLAEKFITVVEVPFEDELFDDFSFDCFDDDDFGDVEKQQEVMNAQSADAQESFSAYQIYSLVKIGVLLQYENAKRVCSRLNRKAKRFIGWSNDSNSPA